MAENEEHIIGIDLGTTNSEVAVLEGEKPVVIVSSEGSNRTPSVVAFLSNNEVAVGDMAVRQAATNPTRTISVIKRLMGRFYSDLTEEDLQCPYKIVDHNDEIMIEVDGKGYTPPQLSSLVLGKLKATAEEYLGAPVKKAVITVPAYFDDLQREATAEAGRLAGLEVLRLINEPTAAAMAYGLGREGQETIAVYDFGGGTFDLSILDVDNNTFEVITSLGDTHLGGEDIDRALLAMISARCQEEHGVDLAADPVSYHRLKEAVEKAKCELSAMQQARVNLPFVANKDGQPIHLDVTLAREELEELVEPLAERTIQICKRALQEAGLKRTQIGKVILVGGTSRIPIVQQMVEEFFDQEPFKGVNPDEAVALGAATQGAVFGGKLEEVVLLDVTPHSLGIEVLGSRFTPIIEKNSTIPIKAGKIFTTTEENQEFVTVHVLQGESENAADNRSIGKFALTGLTPRPKGVPRIQVVFFINSDGIVEIGAKDLESGAEKSLKVVHSHLNENERKERSKRRSKAARAGRRKAAAIKPEFEGVALPEAEGDSAMGESFAEVTGESALVRPETSPEGAPEPATAKKVATGVTPKAATGATQKAATAVTQKAATAVTQKAATAATVRKPAPAAPSSAPVPVPAAPEGGAQAPAVPAAPAPSGDIPESVRMTEAMLAAGKEDTSALLLYESTTDAYKALIAGASGAQAVDWAVLSLSRVYVLRKQPDEAMSLLREARDSNRLSPTQLAAALDFLIERFPNYGPALIERAQARVRQDRLDDAIEDAELAVSREETNNAWADVLESLYRQSIVAQPNPAIEFKMVKLLLQRDKVDDAIDILQRLTENPEYEKRALKILGLCFWQKNLYYLAWQKFKQIEMNDEVKDVLYRLAADMENADQLGNARQVLDHLSEADSNYRDIKSRLQRIAFQIKSQQEDLERSSIPETHQVLKDSRFIIMEEINRGSMGVIYRAKDVVLDEIVALKVLNDYLCADPAAIERFKTEARAARKLTHRNIVRIHDFFESGKKRFISMEYIEGKDLKTILKEEGPFPPRRVAELGSSVALALDYAHSRKVIHRDIKPANLMIAADGEIRITDFGIAKMIHPDATLSSSVIVGTPLYMAPEQIEGGDIDCRADIYALGIVMYELTTGHPPFLEGNIEYHHIHTPPPALPDSVPPRLASIIACSIEKKPAGRFQNAAEMAKALNEFLATLS